jgi:hypothetical protein
MCARRYAERGHADHTFLRHRFDLQQHFHWVGAGERGHYRRRSSATLFAIRTDGLDTELNCAGPCEFLFGAHRLLEGAISRYLMIPYEAANCSPRFQRYVSTSCVQEEGVMTHDTGQPDGYQVQRRQHQKQLQQQQQQQQEHPRIVPGSALPEKEHQSKHNPISETSRFDSHNCDQ